MTTLADSLRDKLDHPRIREQAELVRRALDNDRPVLLSYCPGNSTCYPLVFTPAGPTDAVEWYATVPSNASPTPDSDTWVFVSWLEHGAYPFNLAQVPAPPYIVEKLDRRAGLSDAIALHELFTAIQEAT